MLNFCAFYRVIEKIELENRNESILFLFDVISNFVTPNKTKLYLQSSFYGFSVQIGVHRNIKITE